MKKSNICGEHFDPYGVLPLIFFLLKISILISQPFDLYSCFFLTIEYRRLFFLPFFDSSSSSQIYLYFQCQEEVSGSKFRVRRRCDGCPFFPRTCSETPGCSGPRWGLKLVFLPTEHSNVLQCTEFSTDLNGTQGIQWMPSLLFSDSLFCSPFFWKSAFLLGLTNCKMSKVTTCYSKPDLIPVKTQVFFFFSVF